MKKIFMSLSVVLAMLSFLGICQASSIADKIDKDLNTCLDQSKGVTLTMRECFGTASSQMDKRLNEVYGQLLKKISAEQQTKLKEAQRKWLDFRKAEMDLSLAIDPNAGGTLQLVNADGAAYSLLKKRVADIEGYLKNLEPL